MRYVGYEELDPGYQFPRMKESLEKAEYGNKSKIVKFLKGGTVDLVRVSRARDVFNGKLIPDEVMIMHHGDYYWTNELAWYVEKYNLRLPADFEEYILKHV